jgi:putative chitinase
MNGPDISPALLRGLMPGATEERIRRYHEHIKYYCGRFGVDTPLRIAHFFAQVGHESGDMRFTHELGKAPYFDKYDTGRLAASLGNSPEKDGDGELYKGRGLIQLTGKANYKAFSRWYYGPEGEDRFPERPWEVEENPRACVASAFWFWNSRGLNKIADKDDIVALTKKINGGTNGLKDRNERLARAKEWLRAGGWHAEL